MSEPKPFASLSSSLLARKGAAKPAMRPQGYAMMGSLGQAQAASAAALEDLGWNDMGDQETETTSAPLAEPGRAIRPVASLAIVPPMAPSVPEMPVAGTAAGEALVSPIHPAISVVGLEAEMPVPPVVHQQQALTEKVGTSATVKVPRAEKGSKGKAAFTLRLDGDRHLRLRLASAVTNRSAQRLVTEALDVLLASIQEVETLAGKVSKPRASRNR